MKYTLVVLIVLLFTVFLFPFFIHAAPATPSANMREVSQMQVDYDLPYPGILPDSPFYILKTLRDKIVSFFITDAYKQAEFDLLQADKRLVAGEYLLNRHEGQDTVIISTISKGDNYFEDAITNITKAQQEGRLTNDFLDKLTKANLKHQQILYGMMLAAHGQLKADLGKEIQRVQNMENEVNKLKPHN